MTINVDEIREELRALWGAVAKTSPCGQSKEWTLDDPAGHLEEVAMALGFRFTHIRRINEENVEVGRYFPSGESDFEEERYLTEALIAEYCGLTEEEAS